MASEKDPNGRTTNTRTTVKSPLAVAAAAAARPAEQGHNAANVVNQRVCFTD